MMDYIREISDNKIKLLFLMNSIEVEQYDENILLKDLLF